MAGGDDVIEAVARGIYSPVFAAGIKAGSAVAPHMLPVEARAFLRVQARKALEAIRVPTLGMIEAGMVAAQKEFDEVGRAPGEVSGADEIGAVWRAIIDYALGSGGDLPKPNGLAS